MITILMGVLLAVAAQRSAGPAMLVADDVHEGKVITAGEGKLAIVDDNGENEEFEVTDKTTITRNGKPAGLDDIQEGDVVRVKVQRKGTSYIALNIQARAPE